jgi:hypothetical protein
LVKSARPSSGSRSRPSGLPPAKECTPGGEHGQESSRRDEAESRSRALTKVVRYERAVDAGTDRAGDDDDVSSQFREGQVPISVRRAS